MITESSIIKETSTNQLDRSQTKLTQRSEQTVCSGEISSERASGDSCTNEHGSLCELSSQPSVENDSRVSESGNMRSPQYETEHSVPAMVTLPECTTALEDLQASSDGLQIPAVTTATTNEMVTSTAVTDERSQVDISVGVSSLGGESTPSKTQNTSSPFLRSDSIHAEERVCLSRPQSLDIHPRLPLKQVDSSPAPPIREPTLEYCPTEHTTVLSSAQSTSVPVFNINQRTLIIDNTHVSLNNEQTVVTCSESKREGVDSAYQTDCPDEHRTDDIESEGATDTLQPPVLSRERVGEFSNLATSSSVDKARMASESESSVVLTESQYPVELGDNSTRDHQSDVTSDTRDCIIATAATAAAVTVLGAMLTEHKTTRNETVSPECGTEASSPLLPGATAQTEYQSEMHERETLNSAETALRNNVDLRSTDAVNATQIKSSEACTVEDIRTIHTTYQADSKSPEQRVMNTPVIGEDSELRLRQESSFSDCVGHDRALDDKSIRSIEILSYTPLQNSEQAHQVDSVESTQSEYMCAATQYKDTVVTTVLAEQHDQSASSPLRSEEANKMVHSLSETNFTLSSKEGKDRTINAEPPTIISSPTSCKSLSSASAHVETVHEDDGTVSHRIPTLDLSIPFDIHCDSFITDVPQYVESPEEFTPDSTREHLYNESVEVHEYTSNAPDAHVEHSVVGDAAMQFVCATHSSQECQSVTDLQSADRKLSVCDSPSDLLDPSITSHEAHICISRCLDVSASEQTHLAETQRMTERSMCGNDERTSIHLIDSSRRRSSITEHVGSIALSSQAIPTPPESSLSTTSTVEGKHSTTKSVIAVDMGATTGATSIQVDLSGDLPPTWDAGQGNHFQITSETNMCADISLTFRDHPQPLATDPTSPRRDSFPAQSSDGWPSLRLAGWASELPPHTTGSNAASHSCSPSGASRDLPVAATGLSFGQVAETHEITMDRDHEQLVTSVTSYVQDIESGDRFGERFEQEHTDRGTSESNITLHQHVTLSINCCGESAITDRSAQVLEGPADDSETTQLEPIRNPGDNSASHSHVSERSSELDSSAICIHTRTSAILSSKVIGEYGCDTCDQNSVGKDKEYEAELHACDSSDAFNHSVIHATTTEISTKAATGIVEVNALKTTPSVQISIANSYPPTEHDTKAETRRRISISTTSSDGDVRENQIDTMKIGVSEGTVVTSNLDGLRYSTPAADIQPNIEGQKKETISHASSIVEIQLNTLNPIASKHPAHSGTTAKEDVVVKDNRCSNQGLSLEGEGFNPSETPHGAVSGESETTYSKVVRKLVSADQSSGSGLARYENDDAQGSPSEHSTISSRSPVSPLGQNTDFRPLIRHPGDTYHSLISSGDISSTFVTPTHDDSCTQESKMTFSENQSIRLDVEFSYDIEQSVHNCLRETRRTTSSRRSSSVIPSPPRQQQTVLTGTSLRIRKRTVSLPGTSIEWSSLPWWNERLSLRMDQHTSRHSRVPDSSSKPLGTSAEVHDSVTVVNRVLEEREDSSDAHLHTQLAALDSARKIVSALSPKTFLDVKIPTETESLCHSSDLTAQVGASKISTRNETVTSTTSLATVESVEPVHHTPVPLLDSLGSKMDFSVSKPDHDASEPINGGSNTPGSSPTLPRSPTLLIREHTFEPSSSTYNSETPMPPGAVSDATESSKTSVTSIFVSGTTESKELSINLAHDTIASLSVTVSRQVIADKSIDEVRNKRVEYAFGISTPEHHEHESEISTNEGENLVDHQSESRTSTQSNSSTLIETKIGISSEPVTTREVTPNSPTPESTARQGEDTLPLDSIDSDNTPSSRNSTRFVDHESSLGVSSRGDLVPDFYDDDLLATLEEGNFVMTGNEQCSKMTNTVTSALSEVGSAALRVCPGESEPPGCAAAQEGLELKERNTDVNELDQEAAVPSSVTTPVHQFSEHHDRDAAYEHELHDETSSSHVENTSGLDHHGEAVFSVGSPVESESSTQSPSVLASTVSDGPIIITLMHSDAQIRIDIKPATPDLALAELSLLTSADESAWVTQLIDHQQYILQHLLHDTEYRPITVLIVDGLSSVDHVIDSAIDQLSHLDPTVGEEFLLLCVLAKKDDDNMTALSQIVLGIEHALRSDGIDIDALPAEELQLGYLIPVMVLEPSHLEEVGGEREDDTEEGSAADVEHEDEDVEGGSEVGTTIGEDAVREDEDTAKESLDEGGEDELREISEDESQDKA